MHLLLLASLITNPIIYVRVEPIHEISVQPMTKSITIPFCQGITTLQSSYSVTTNGDNQKIVGALTPSLPDNLKISAKLQAPNGAQSLGKVNLSSQNSILVSGISRIAQKNLCIIYTFTSSAPILPGTYSEIVQFTLID